MERKRPEMSEEAKADLRMMADALAPRPIPTTPEEKKREAKRNWLLQYKSREEAKQYRKRYLSPKSPSPGATDQRPGMPKGGG
jgi:hypothetical protein